MESIPQLFKVMTRLTILLDCLAREVLALFDPLHQVPRAHIGNRDFLYPFGKEVALGFVDSTAKRTPILFLARDRVIVERGLAGLGPPRLGLRNYPGGTSKLLPGIVKRVGHGLRHGIDLSGRGGQRINGGYLRYNGPGEGIILLGAALDGEPNDLRGIKIQIDRYAESGRGQMKISDVHADAIESQACLRILQRSDR